MPLDSSATRARIVEAAFREFATYGLAGARVDRIAEQANANKRALYAYFGNKEKLFEITVVNTLLQGVQDVPRAWSDLPEYAGLVYDYFLADPDRMRIHLWRQLERPGPVPGEQEAYQQILTEMDDAGIAGNAWHPIEVFALIWALHHTWFLASPALLALQPGADQEAALVQRRRAVIVEATRRLTGG